MYRTSSILAILLVATTISAQVEHGGIPASLSRSLAPPAGVRMPVVDINALSAEDAINDLDKSIPWRFGKNHAVDLDLNNSGSWTTLEDGSRLWRLGIECPGALSVNFEFHDFRPVPGGKIFVIDGWGRHIGAFTQANDHGEHVLGVQAMKGSRITVEYQVPATGPVGQLRIGQVTHGYRDVFAYDRALGSSGSCNNNVICSVGDAWRDEIRSVAMITVNGSGICTGTLINNCAQDGTPYFLTANHCLPGNLNVSTWVFRFNWNSPSCTQNQNGPTNQTISGASLLANSAATDVGLLRLNSTPPASYNVYYSGWDKSGAFPTSQTAIHHPSGDVKKISFDTDAAGQATYGGASCWRIFTWEDGTTEPGSSGSGLWDQNHRLIGQLYGGQATCSNNVNDYYGRLDLSYAVLQNWLGNCGNTLNGYDPNVAAVALDAQLNGIAGVSGDPCSASRTPQITVRNGGSTTLTSFVVNWSVAGGASGTIPWNGSLATGATVVLSPGALSLVEGTNTFTATVTAPNGGSDQAPANDQAFGTSYYGTIAVNLALTLDRYGDETTWEIRSGTTVVASGGPYARAASNGAYPQAPITVCLASGCYDLVVLDSYGDGMCCAYGNGAFTLSDAQGGPLASGASFTNTSTHPFCVTATAQVQLSARVFLEGPFDSGTQLMSDALRSGGLLPSSEPYTALGYTQSGGGGETVQAGVFNTTGSNAIVDWVLVELHSVAPAYNLVATRNGLVQRDGDIVDMDGTSPLVFNAGAGNYHVAVRHRNHLGVMSANAIALSGSTTVVDLRIPATATYGTEATRTIGAVRALWAGNCLNDGQLLYTGSGNDRDRILARIGGSVPTNTVNGFYLEDVNMDGQAKYTGGTNDRDMILFNIGGTVPTNSRNEQLP
ncbi:MAG: trypsin-like peptidase domain-containing protein [Flavobacteriales bacterium]